MRRSSRRTVAADRTNNAASCCRSEPSWVIVVSQTESGDTSPGCPFERLVELVAYLRSDEGCPWDREQTMESMIECLEEESREVVEAVREGDMDNLEEELGDFILQGVFYAQMAREKDLFDIGDVLRRLNEKLVSRHPHVFGEESAESPEEAIDHWNEVKEGSAPEDETEF